jgi:ubiquinone/menaquinone biosynthesis C-methylase UbiE
MSTEHSQEVARVFDEWAQAGRDEGMADRHGLSARPVLEELTPAADDRFLDLGAGNAWAARWAQAAGARAVAVDVSPEMLARAREAQPAPGLVQASFERLPFTDRSFAFLFSMEALYYAEDLDQALAEAFRAAETGGELHALVDYYEGNPASEGWPDKTGVDMHRLSPEGWEARLTEAGFTDVGTARVCSEEGESWRAEHGSLHVYGRRP